MNKIISSALFMLLLSGLIFLTGCNPAGQTKIADSFMPGVNSSRFISIISGNNQTASHSLTLAQPLVVKVRDDQDEALANVRVYWTMVTGTGMTSSQFTFTNEQGEASVQLSLGQPGLHTVTATVEDSSSSVTFTATATTTGLSSSWAFTSALDYDFDPGKIQFYSGICSLTPFDQMDDDDSLAGFGGGTHLGTIWDNTNEYLKLNTTTNTSELDPNWTPQWSSLISYWKMNNNWNDSKGSNHGTAIGNSTFSTAAKSGSHAGLLDGSGDSVNMDSGIGTLTGHNSGTVMGWFKANAGGSYYYLYSISHGAGSSNMSGLTIGNCTSSIADESLCFSFQRAGSLQLFMMLRKGSSVFFDNRWHHVAVVTGNGANAIYVDGISQPVYYGAGSATTNEFSNITLADSIRIGGLRYGNGEYSFPHNGLLDDFAVWSTPLTSREIESIYSRQAAKYAGLYTSRIMDSLTPQSWTNLEVQADSLNLDLTSGLKGHWHLDETSASPGIDNDLVDSSGEGNHLEAMGGFTFNGLGKINRAITLNGTTGYARSASTNTLTMTGSMTVSAWIYPTGAGSSSPYGGIIVNKEGEYEITRFTNGTIQYAIANTTPGWNFVNSGFVAPLNTWSHIVWMYDPTASSNQFRVFANGVQVHTATGSGAIGDTQPSLNEFWIGARAGMPMAFDGTLDEVAIWNRVLTADEVTQLYREGTEKIKLQVRSCSQSDCADGIWQGPTGTNQSYFSQLENAFNVNGRYFQYQALLETDDEAVSPKVKKIRVSPDHFDTNSPAVISRNPISFHQLSSLTETLGVSCSEGVVYNLSLNKTSWYWWNGSHWTLANGSASEANSISVISGHASSFSTQVGRGSLHIKAFLKSNGSSQCELDAVEVSGEN